MGPRMREDTGGEIVTGQVLCGNNGREGVVVWCDRMGGNWTEKG